MSENFKRYTVTAALPYANGPVHIGHLAGAYLPSDIYVRYKRSLGTDVIFVCGSDEHGVAITMKAKKEGISPQEVIDKYNALMRDAFKDFGISFDIFSRTSNKVHHETAQEFFKTIFNKGGFDVQETLQYFDEEANQFLADRYITGTCPKCANPSAYGDQCERCGSSLNATDLIEPKSALSGNKPILKATKNWFLPLNKLQQKVSDYLDLHKDWKPNVYGQCRSWLDSGDGLQPRSMTRDLDWGIKVPLEGADGKVLYVWFDAPIGYISATKELKPNDWEKYWKDKDTRLIHFIGKDNIVFHCITFPAILMEHGDYILPDNVPANEFLNIEGDKVSTSRNWAVWLHEYLIDFKDKQDVLRYVLTATMPETKDNDFTWKDFQTRNNSELVAILGNFVNRTLVLTHKFYDGKVPAASEYKAGDINLLESLAKTPDKISASLEQFRFREALSEAMSAARMGNKYLADEEPWKLIATNPERVKTIINVALQICANLSIVLEPFLPFTSKKLSAMLNLPTLQWNDAKRVNNLNDHHIIQAAQLLFEKIEDEAVEAQVQKLHANKIENAQSNMEENKNQIEAQKPAINFDDFSKMDIRVGTILEAEKVPKADKLLKLFVDTGIDKRTVVSGIAEHFNPENLIGQQVSILVNLEPRKLKGIESQGMILMAENEQGKLVFVAPNPATNNGAIIK
jgi:methionyl-tRNA synthetase